MRFISCLSGAAVAAAVVCSLSAAAVAGPLSDYGLVLFDDYNFQGGDVRGRTLIGGDLLAGGNSPVFAVEVPTNPKTNNLIVGGNITAANINMQSGHIVHGGSISVGNINHNGGGSTIFSPGVNALAEQTYLQNESAYYATLASTGTFSSGFFTHGAGAVAVFNINAAQLGPNNTLQMNPGSAGTVLINVHGNNPNLGGVNFGGTGFQQNVGPGNVGWSNILWNFPDATTLNLQGIGFKGSILAPYANVTGGSQIDGSMAAFSYTGATEFHHFPFTGEIPAPGFAALAGVAGLASLRRRR